MRCELSGKLSERSRALHTCFVTIEGRDWSKKYADKEHQIDGASLVKHMEWESN